MVIQTSVIYDLSYMTVLFVHNCDQVRLVIQVNFINCALRHPYRRDESFRPESKSASFITSTIKYLRTLPLNGDLHVNVAASASSEYSQPPGVAEKGQRSRQAFARNSYA